MDDQFEIIPNENCPTFKVGDKFIKIYKMIDGSEYENYMCGLSLLPVELHNIFLYKPCEIQEIDFVVFYEHDMFGIKSSKNFDKRFTLYLQRLYNKIIDVKWFIKQITTGHSTYRVFIAPFKKLEHFHSEKLTKNTNCK